MGRTNEFRGFIGRIRSDIDADATEILVSNSSHIQEGGKAYVKLGSGVNAEWISYTGRERNQEGTFNLTGVTRGILGTMARIHLNGTSIDAPHQYVNCQRARFGTRAVKHAPGRPVVPVGVLEGCTRGVADTVAAAHAKGAKIAIFANVDDAIRMTAAHELGHVLRIKHTVNRHIMNKAIGRGSYLNNGLYNDYLQESKNEVNTR